MLNESTVEKHLIKRCKAAGWKCSKLVDIGNNGFPDRTVFKTAGDLFFVETKRKDGKLSPKQALRKTQLEARGFRVYVPYSKADVDEIIELEQRI